MKTKSGNREAFSRSSIIFLAIGLTCLLATGLSAFYFRHSVGDLVPALLAEAALIFLSALVVERNLLKEFGSHAHERVERLSADLQTEINRFFRAEFSVLKYAHQYNVELLPPRRSMTRNPDVTYKRIAEAVSRAKFLKVFCTSGIDIFPPPNTIETPIVAMIRDRATRGDHFAITVLSCEPNGEYAAVRGKVENHINPGCISRDVEDSRASIMQIAAAVPGAEFTWSWYTYDFVPQSWFVITDNEGFVEPYHFGLGLRAPKDPNSCIGGRVPVLYMSAGSSLWNGLNEYFDFLVSPNEDSSVEDLRKGYFRVKCIHPARSAEET